jgi:beta-N-acetylhexosaminidase
MMRAMPARRRPPDRSVRRRRGAVAIVAALALAAGVAVGAGRGADGSGSTHRPGAARAADRPPRAAVDELSLPQQVGQLVVLRFAGTTPPGYVRRVLRQDRAAGAILFRDNATTPEQVTAVSRTLRASAGRRTPLICVDQEGGAVRILPWSPPAASQPDQLAAGTVGADARAAGDALRAQGISVTLGPVADVPSVPGSAIAGRQFATDPETAGAAVAEAVRGWRAAGVAPTLKHFPGLGGAGVNTDFGSATVGRGGDELASDLVPFRDGVAAGAEIVMVSSAVHAALDPAHIGSQSPAVAVGLLRDELGFRGVAMTDSIEAAAVRAVTPDPGAAAVASIAAGMDVVLTTGRGSYIHVHRALLARARADRAFRARVRESAARVLALRARLR